VTIRVQELTVSVPDVRAFRWSCNEPYTDVKSFYAVARVERGCTEYRAAGKRWRATPGTVVLKQPGDVHHDTTNNAATMQVVVLPSHMIEAVAACVRVAPQLAANDERGVAFHRVHDAIANGAERFVLEVALAEAAAAFASLAAPTTPRPIRRALELLRARFADPVTLEELAIEVGLGKFHLCHAFRAQLGIPPYAYLVQLRVAHAKTLLAAGIKRRDVAPQVGFYDQSQLNRHFRRIVGVTPGQFQRG
jgi:AraC-like DNA-binding protein